MINLIKQITKLVYYKIKTHPKKVVISNTANIIRGTKFEGRNKICSHTKFKGYLGLCSYIGPHSNITAKIGRFTSISSGVEVITGVHPYKSPYVSTSPIFVSLKQQLGFNLADEQFFEEFRYADTVNKYDVIIGNDCWIGYKASIVAGVNIHDGAVVLSHALVTKDVPSYAIVGGVPAKIIGYRYSIEQINCLLEIQWWNFDYETISRNRDYFLNIEKFISKFSSKNKLSI